MSYSKPSKTPYRVVLVAALFLLSVMAISVVFRRGGLVETVPTAGDDTALGQGAAPRGGGDKSTAKRREPARPPGFRDAAPESGICQ